MERDLILGTAGHIDHGKTALVRALTGIETDRLPEERQRGITIDLGFAELCLGDYRLGLVDVPGHERFVRNMLAVATGMDLALLAVAADDSVKPQTREHLDILRLLDLPAGVIALTKCDLVGDRGWLELVEDEIRELTRGSFLERAPIVRTSTVSGEGLETLREALLAAAESAWQRRSQAVPLPFRMAIDRSFTLAGHGTVVTGSVLQGQVRSGDSLLIEPGGLAVRVRGLRRHGRPAECLLRGQRAAINLAGVHHDQIERGQELASPGLLRPARVLTIQLGLLDSEPRPLKDRSRVRLHLGTAEIPARIRLLQSSALEPGGTAFAQLTLARPAVASWRQPLILRNESPVRTLGGGHVVDPEATRIPARLVDPDLLQQLLDERPAARAAASIALRGLRPWEPADLVRLAGIDSPEMICDALEREGQLIRWNPSPSRTARLQRRVWDRLGERLVQRLHAMHDREPLRLAFPAQRLAAAFPHLAAAGLLPLLVQHLKDEGRIQSLAGGLALNGRGPQLSQNERKLLQDLIHWIRQDGLETSSPSDYQQRANRNQQAVPQLLAMAVQDGQLVRINAEYYLHHETLDNALMSLRQAFADRPALTVSQIREILGTSRKFAVPLCEYLDQTGFTRRQDDLRCLAAQPDPTAPSPT